ncbi:unnamed protein product [Closterium sp. NIES-65]|nr:unnamed protein product [Closterium sp. NIES-65]
MAPTDSPEEEGGDAGGAGEGSVEGGEIVGVGGAGEGSDGGVGEGSDGGVGEGSDGGVETAGGRTTGGDGGGDLTESTKAKPVLQGPVANRLVRGSEGEEKSMGMRSRSVKGAMGQEKGNGGEESMHLNQGCA